MQKFDERLSIDNNITWMRHDLRTLYGLLVGLLFFCLVNYSAGNFSATGSWPIINEAKTLMAWAILFAVPVTAIFIDDKSNDIARLKRRLENLG